MKAFGWHDVLEHRANGRVNAECFRNGGGEVGDIFRGLERNWSRQVRLAQSSPEGSVDFWVLENVVENSAEGDA